MNDHYAYLVGALIYDVAWVACYSWCKSYRAQIIWGSLVSAPFALTSILFIPQYWSPPSLFNLDARFKVGIEDFLWAAAVGGIASVIREAFLKERFAARRGQKRQRHFAPFVVMGVLFLILEFWHPGQTMYNMIFALLVGALVVIIIRPDLTLLMLVGSGLFTALYWVLFLYFLAFFPEFISKYYNVSNLRNFHQRSANRGASVRCGRRRSLERCLRIYPRLPSCSKQTLQPSRSSTSLEDFWWRRGESEFYW